MTDLLRFNQPNQIGPILRALRTAQDVTQIDVAEAMGASSTTNLCAIERGRRNADLSTILAILAELGHELAVVPIRAEVRGRRCTIPGCGRRHRADGMCHSHYMRRYRMGRVRAEVPIGEGRKGARAAVGGAGFPDDEL